MGEVSDRLSAALAGRYAIEHVIGTGAMATVYLARDLRHDRRVALKVLSPDLAAVLGVERFLAEIRLTANLQHPHLLPLFDSGEAGGLLFYVMPFVEGESLRARLERERQLPIEECVRIACAVAEALDYAHRQGVVHRDLKPENILLQDGQPLVADFGIALAVRNAGGERLTRTGLVVGTPAYMSPEQATGDRDVDGRSDVYALAALTYEMLVGDPPHRASTSQAVVAKLLTERPRGVRSARPTVPSHIASSIERALEKLPADRWNSARDFAEALEGKLVLDAPRDSVRATDRRRAGRRSRLAARWRTWPASVSALALVAIVAVVAVANPIGSPVDSATDGIVRLDLNPPADMTFESVVVSPDGSHLAFAAADPAGATSLWVRPIDGEAREITGTDGALYPFWSPDSRRIGFFADGKLKTVDLGGGLPQTICDLLLARGGPTGGAWGPDGTILFAEYQFRPSPIFKVAESGGEPTPVPAPATAAAAFKSWPVFLPDGRRFLYLSLDAQRPDSSGIYIGSLDAPEAVFVGKAESSAAFVADPTDRGGGYLLFLREQTLLAQSFDPERGALSGEPIPVVEGVGRDTALRARFSAPSAGILVFGGGSGNSALQWVDRSGRPNGSVGPEGRHIGFKISPCGRSLAVQRMDGIGKIQIWRYDVSGGPQTQVTFDSVESAGPVWSPDESRITFFRTQSSGWSILEKASNGEGLESVILATGTDLVPTDWSPDGSQLLYHERQPDNDKSDIWILPAKRASEAERGRPFVSSAADEMFGMFSPDGQWVAYQSDQTGRNEIYVRSASSTDAGPGGTPISTNGGIQPRWAPDGREILYLAPDNTLMAAEISTRPTLSVGSPRALFATRPAGGVQRYDVGPDGRILVAVPTDDSSGAPIKVVLNWLAGLTPPR